MMSIFQRVLRTVLVVLLISAGIAAATKTRNADAAEVSPTQTTQAETSTQPEPEYVCTTLPQYAWAYDESLPPKELLMQVLREKNMKPELETLALASFDRLTENYDDAYSVFRSSGVPDLRTVQMHYVFAIAHTKTFDTFTGNEYELEDCTMHFGSPPSGFFAHEYDLMCVNADYVEPGDIACDLFLHEMLHAYQDAFLDSEYNDETGKDYIGKGFNFVLTEGDAQLMNAGGSDMIASRGLAFYNLNDEQETCLLQSGGTYDKIYNMAYKINTILTHLLGYDTMQLMRYQPDTKREEAYLSQKYGIDGEKFLHACSLVAWDEYTGYNWFEEEDGRFTKDDDDPVAKSKYLEYVDRVFVQCLAQEIRNIETFDRQAVEDFYHFYRYYKLQYMSQARIEAADGYEMITDAFYDTGAVEDELYTKCQRAGLFRIAEDETENRRAFDALLCLTQNREYCFISLKGSETVLRGDTVTVTKNGRIARYDCGD